VQARRRRNRQLSGCSGGHFNSTLDRPHRPKRWIEAEASTATYDPIMAARLADFGALLMLLGAGLGSCGGDADRALVPVPIGRSPAFRPPSLSGAVAQGRPVGGLRCGPSRRARFGVHVEVFARGRVVVVPAGIGIAPPRQRDGAYIDGGRCHYPLLTREPTGVVEVTMTGATLGDLFALWGQPLAARRVAGFRGVVRAAVGGRPWLRDLREIPLVRHAQIVVQVGPPIPPHARYRFPPGL
jgi:hypothetical protein